MDAARMAAQSDPDRNPQFRRRWSEPPLNRKSPRIAGTIQGLEFKVGSSDKEISLIGRILQLAMRLDRAADAELALGHHLIAERLSRQAAELREGGR